MTVFINNSCILVLSIFLCILCHGAESKISSSHKISKRVPYSYLEGDCIVYCHWIGVSLCKKICPPTYQKPIPNLDEKPFPDPNQEIIQYPTQRPPIVQNLRVSEAKCKEFIENLPEKRRRLRRWILITGGDLTSNGDYPHVGAIGWITAQSLIFKCGASLISSKFVLTAAHCSKAPIDGDMMDMVPKIVRLGDKNINDGKIDPRVYKEAHKVDVNIRRIIVHPKYEPFKEYHDIGLMELEHDVIFNNFIQPACLWNKPDFDYKRAIIAGWGAEDAEIKAATVDVIDSATCDKHLKDSFCSDSWCGVKDQICAGNTDGSIGVCNGDSGMPLQLKMHLKNEEHHMYYVAGVTASGFGCGLPKTPSLFTKVSSYIDWIESNVWP